MHFARPSRLDRVLANRRAAYFARMGLLPSEESESSLIARRDMTSPIEITGDEDSLRRPSP